MPSKGSSLKHCQIINFLVLKVMVTLTMTFSTKKCHLLVRTNILSEGHSPKHCQVIKLFSTKGPSALDLCPQDHLLVRTNISTKFEGSSSLVKQRICLFTQLKYKTRGPRAKARSPA